MNFRAAVFVLFVFTAASLGVQAQDIEAGKKKAEEIGRAHV